MENRVQDAPWASLDNGSDEDSGLEIWGFLQRRKSFIILLAIAGAGLGYLYFTRQTYIYSSRSLVQVIHHDSDPRVDGLLAERNLSDSQYVITSSKLLKECIEEPTNELKQLETLRGLSTEDAIGRIRGMMSAESLAANIVELSCTGANPSDTSKIANAVTKAFTAHQKESYQDAVGKLQNLLETAKDELTNRLNETEKNFAEFEKTSPLLGDGANIHRQRLTAINENVSKLVIDQTALKAELKGLEEALRNGGKREALLLLVGKQSDGEVGDTRENTEAAVRSAQSIFQALMPLLLEEAMLAEEFGPEHPKLVAIRRRIEITRSHSEKLAGMAPQPDVDGQEAQPRPDFLAVYLSSLQTEIDLLDQKRLALDSKADEEANLARGLRDAEHTRADFQRKIARDTSILEDVLSQLANMDLPTSMGGVTTTVLTPARHGTLVYPKLPEFLGLGAFLGAFAGLALGYIVEMADRSFRKPEEIIREFGIPIVGHIPYMQEQKLRKIPTDTVVDRTVISLHLPRSRPAEAYRSVRTAVCFSAIGSNHRVIQVTSPAAGDGKSTLAMNFAVSMAQSGKKTVIVESDFRRPKVHKLTGVDNSVGIVDVLRGTAELADAIQSTELDSFFVMPCGSRPRNPSELLTRPEYEQVLEMLREKFDYVVIDTPPVLVVTDPCSVSPRVDGVLLCVRLSRHTREFGRRALEQLRDVGANMTGIVVNGVEESDAYGYGNYSYSDYRYRYKEYNYEDKSDESYFADADADVMASKSV